MGEFLTVCINRMIGIVGLEVVSEPIAQLGNPSHIDVAFGGILCPPAAAPAPQQETKPSPAPSEKTKKKKKKKKTANKGGAPAETQCGEVLCSLLSTSEER